MCISVGNEQHDVEICTHTICNVFVFFVVFFFGFLTVNIIL